MNELDRQYITIISHTDLDGYSANVLGEIYRRYVRDVQMSYINIGYNTSLNDTIKTELNKLNKIRVGKKLLIICDLSFDKTTIDLVYDICTNNSIHVVFCDHHQQSVQYQINPIHSKLIDTFVVVDNPSGNPNDMKCGSCLLHSYLMNPTTDIIKPLLIPNPSVCTLLTQYMFNVNDHDCWIWKVHNNDFAEQLNIYFTAVTKDTFVKTIVNIIVSGTKDQSFKELLLSSNAGFVISERERDIKNTQITMAKNMRISKFNKEYTIGAVICDRYISSVGNYLCEINPNIDFCMLINPMIGYVSFRGIRDDINLARIAKTFGGNGHKLSAAAAVDNNMMLELIKNHILINKR